MALTRKRARTEVDDDDGATIASNPKLAATEVDHVTKNDHASAINNSPAAKFNRLVMRKLTKALEQDPETDITRIVPSSYTATLARRLSTQQDQCDKNGSLLPNASTGVKIAYKGLQTRHRLTRSTTDPAENTMIRFVYQQDMPLLLQTLNTLLK